MPVPARTNAVQQHSLSTTGLVELEAELEGLTPIMHNRVSMETLEKIRNKEKAPKTAPKGTPREECETKVYVDSEGWPYIPTECLFSCLVNAGQHVRLDGKRQVSTTKSTMLPGFLTLLDAHLRMHLPGEPRKKAAWEVDMRQGKNPNGGELVCICRPRFDLWAVTANVQIDTNEIGEDVIRQLFDIAGRRIGLLDFRPNRKGIYGQFVIRRWETKKDK